MVQINEQEIGINKGNAYHFPALLVEVLSILEDGGLIPHVRKEFGKAVDVALQDQAPARCWTRL